MDISVIVPVYNGEEEILECVNSILIQNIPRLEIIFVNDGSTDNTGTILENLVEKYDFIKVYSFIGNRGVSDASNFGIQKSTGKYIARIDIDDIMMPSRLKIQYEFLEKNPHIDILGTGQRRFFNNDYRDYYPSSLNDEIYASLFVKTTMLHSTLLIRRKALVDIFYDRNYKYGEDYKLFIDLLKKKCKFANIKEILNTYDYTNEKKWDGLNPDSITLIRNIWNENFKILGYLPKEKDFRIMEYLSGKSTPASFFDVILCFAFSFKLTIYNSGKFGNNFYFLKVRFIETLHVLKRYLFENYK